MFVKEDKLRELLNRKLDLEKKLSNKNTLTSSIKRSVLEDIYKTITAEIIAIDGAFTLTIKEPKHLCIEKDIKDVISEEENELISYYFKLYVEDLVNSLFNPTSS